MQIVLTVYVHVGNSQDGKIYISFFAKVVSGARVFNVKVTQVS